MVSDHGSAPYQPNEQDTGRYRDGPRQPQGLLGCLGRRFKEPAPDAGRQSPNQALDHENEADGDSKVVHAGPDRLRR
jgi:hypothetical protein